MSILYNATPYLLCSTFTKKVSWSTTDVCVVCQFNTARNSKLSLSRKQAFYRAGCFLSDDPPWNIFPRGVAFIINLTVHQEEDKRERRKHLNDKISNTRVRIFNRDCGISNKLAVIAVLKRNLIFWNFLSVLINIWNFLENRKKNLRAGGGLFRPIKVNLKW